MKVALFVHCFYPTHYYGTEAYTLSLARNLVARGVIREGRPYDPAPRPFPGFAPDPQG